MSCFTFLHNDAKVLENFRHNPKRYLPIAQFAHMVMCTSSSLEAKERNLIAAYVSSLHACDDCYGASKICEHCMGASEAISFTENVDLHVLKSALSDLTTAPMKERLRQLLAFVRKLTLTPSKIVNSDIEALCQAGWDEQALEEAIDICALFNFINRLVVV